MSQGEKKILDYACVDSRVQEEALMSNGKRVVSAIVTTGKATVMHCNRVERLVKE
jgi:hypothetical protein